MRYHGDCFTPETLTLEFTVRGRTVVIQNADTNDCLVNRGLASDLAGTTLRVPPLTPGRWPSTDGAVQKAHAKMRRSAGSSQGQHP